MSDQQLIIDADELCAQLQDIPVEEPKTNLENSNKEESVKNETEIKQKKGKKKKKSEEENKNESLKKVKLYK